MRKRIILLVIVGIGISLLVIQNLNLIQLTPIPMPEYDLNINTKAPDFSLNDIDGNNVKLSNYKGKVIVIFWDTKCAGCGDYMLDLQSFQKSRNDVIVLGVNLQEETLAVVNFADELGITYPILLDQNGEARELYNVTIIPTTYFIKDEIIKDKRYKAISSSELESIANSLA